MSSDAKPSGFTIRRPSSGGEAIGSDDTEGQSIRVGSMQPGEGAVPEDDTEGQMLVDPSSSRAIAGAREHQIRHRLSQHGLAEDARRPNRKEK